MRTERRLPELKKGWGAVEQSALTDKNQKFCYVITQTMITNTKNELYMKNKTGRIVNVFAMKKWLQFEELDMLNSIFLLLLLLIHLFGLFFWDGVSLYRSSWPDLTGYTRLALNLQFCPCFFLPMARLAGIHHSFNQLDLQIAHCGCETKYHMASPQCVLSSVLMHPSKTCNIQNRTETWRSLATHKTLFFAFLPL